eukprot:SAG31_NODE_763_length_12265_cov_3.024984_10_plen_100_part_00
MLRFSIVRVRTNLVEPRVGMIARSPATAYDTLHLPGSAGCLPILNLVTQPGGFIIRDTQVIESQTYPISRLSYIFLRKKKAVRVPVGVQAANVEALKLT